MPQTTPPTVTPAPTPAIQRGDRTTFSARVDAFITWLAAAPAQFAALATNVYNNAVDAFTSATAAQTARNAVEGFAAGLLGTSTSAQTISTGTKTFITQTGKDFAVGNLVYITNPNNAAQWMAGTVSSYSGAGALVVSVVDVAPGAAGQNASTWNISPSGFKGAHRFDVVTVPDGVIDLQNGRNSYFKKTQGSSQNYTIINPPPGGSSFTFKLRLDAGVPGFPASVLTPENGTLTLLTGRTHLITFITDDGGTTWNLGSLRNYLNS